MKKHLLPLAGGIILVTTLAKIITIPAVAQTIRAAFVKNIDEKGRNPYQMPLKCNSTNGLSCAVAVPAVPAGQRLVVENIKVVAIGSGLGSVLVQFDHDNYVTLFPAVYGYQDSTGTQVYYFTNATVTTFLDQNSAATFTAVGSTGKLSEAQFEVSGYLVNLNN